MSVVTILIAAAFAAGVSYVLHLIDKDNNSMEKVKKYADKRQGEIEAFIKEQVKFLSDNTASLETKQMQAAAAIKRLDGQIAEFNKIAQNLKGDTDAVNAIEAKIKSYDKVLNELVDMTASVEENLQLVKKESLIVDKLNARLAEQDKNLDAIEKRIPAISSDFAKKNGEQLQLLGNKLLSEYDSHGEKLKADIQQIEGSAQKALSAFQNEISAVYEEASLKAEKLEDQAFEHLSQKASERSDAYIKNMNEKVSALEANLSENVGKVNADMEAALSNITAQFASKIQQVEKLIDERSRTVSTAAESKTVELDKKYNEIYVELSGRFKQKTSEMEEELAVKSAEVQNTFKESAGSVVQNVKEAMASMEAKCKARIDEIAAKYDERLNVMNEKYGKQLEGAGSKNDVRIVELQNKITQADEKAKAHIDALTAKYQQAVNTIKERYEAALASIDGKNNQRILELEQQYDQAYEVVNKKVVDSNNSFEELYNSDIKKLKDSYTSLLSEVQTDYTTRMGEFNAKYEKSFEEFNSSVESGLSEVESKYSQAFSNVKEQFALSAESFRNQYDETFKELDSKYDEATRNLRDQIETVQKLYSEKEGGMNSEITQKIDSLAAEYNAQISELRSRMEASMSSYEQLAKTAEENIDSYNSKIDAKIETVKNQLADTLNSISKNVDASVQTAENTVQRVKEECQAALSKLDEVEPELNEKVQAIDTKIDGFREKSAQKMAELDEVLKSSGQKIEQMCEKQQAAALSDVDKQLSAYKKDMEYRLSKLEGIGSQVDLLEASLKNAMEEVSRRTISRFDSFSADQEQKQVQFAASVKENNEQLESDLQIIESKIEELKKTAIGSMSEKLAGFEELFDRDLKTRGDKINDDLATWKNNFDGKITAFTTEYETQRREIETEYNRELQEKLAAVQAKSEEQAERLANGIKSSEAAANEHISEIKVLLSNFASEMQAKVNKVDESSDEALKNAMAHSQKSMGEQLEKLQNQMLEELKAFEESVSGRQETSISSIDSTLTEFKTWKAQIKAQLEESKSIFKNEIDGLKEQAENKVRDARQYVENEYKQLYDQSERKVSELEDKATESLSEFEDRSKEIHARLEKMYDDMLGQTENRMNVQAADISRKIQDFSTQLNEMTDANRNTQSELSFKLQGFSNEVQTQMSEIAKELQSVRSQLSVYEKADQMKKALDEKIQLLTDDFERIEGFKDVASDLNREYNQIVNLKNDLDHKIDSFEEQKVKVDTIGQRYEKMISLSGQIDDKIRELNTTFDGLQTMEVQVRDFQDTLSVISGRYDRLEQKNVVIDRVLKDVDTSFENLKNLEDRLRECTKQADSLPAKILDVQNNVDELLKHGPKIGEAAAKLNNLQEILSEAENKLEEVNAARSGVGRIEEKFLKMDKDLDGKLKLVQSMVNADLKNKPVSSDEQFIPEQTREQVKSLARQGWTVGQIAKALKRTPAEISLILELPSDI